MESLATVDVFGTCHCECIMTGEKEEKKQKKQKKRSTRRVRETSNIQRETLSTLTDRILAIS